MKRLTTGLALAALAAFGATGSVAYADHHGGRHTPDADGDGLVTKDEVQAHSAQMFARMDANGDGKLDEADREVRRQERREEMFARLDADNDGQVSKQEFMAFEHEGKRGQHRRMGDWRGNRGNMMALRADANRDGAISQAEFTEGMLKHFDHMDANKDGKVTKEERDAARSEMRDKWRERMSGQNAN